MPDTMPPLLRVETGLNPKLKDEKVIFEKYVQTRMGNAEANRLFANGDLYKIFLSSNQHLKRDNISWQRAGAISEAGLNEMRDISKNSLVDYINDGPPERVAKAVENVNWYFYFDEPIFVQSQLRASEGAPKFARKMNEALEGYLTFE